jgi:hypothetical protein
MGIIVSAGRSQTHCDTPGCGVRSLYIEGENDGQGRVVEVTREHGWQYTTGGRAYCPDHAFGAITRRAGDDDQPKHGPRPTNGGETMGKNETHAACRALKFTNDLANEQGTAAYVYVDGDDEIGTYNTSETPRDDLGRLVCTVDPGGSITWPHIVRCPVCKGKSCDVRKLGDCPKCHGLGATTE